MNQLEKDYKTLLQDILDNGDFRSTRNARTKALFGKQLIIDIKDGEFPLLTSRKMFPKGVLGELAAMLKGPKNLESFEKEGCPYWKLWADENGELNVDYGNTWINFNGSGVNQLQNVLDKLKNNRTDRRMLVVGTNPQNLELSLPSCHILYQWFVREDKYLDMMWYQRSVDTAIGLPSDIIIAYTWNLMMSKDSGLEPGKIIMNLGDTHIYEPHFDKVKEYIARPEHELPKIKFTDSYTNIWNFCKDDIEILDYKHEDKMTFELLA